MSTGSSIQSAFLDAISGRWAGVLEYRDYDASASSPDRVRLPTWLAVSTDRTGAAIFTYIYDDGPKKVRTERSLDRFDVNASTWTTTAGQDTAAEIEAVAGYSELKNGRGVLVATGPGSDRGLPVDKRTTWLIQRNLLEWTLETRQTGGSYTFQHTYVFTRVTPPVSAAAASPYAR